MSTTSRQQFRFNIRISQQEFLRHYRGTASAVQVISECGRRLRFPASRLRPFLTHTGISGRFLLTVDADNRFLELKKIT